MLQPMASAGCKGHGKEAVQMLVTGGGRARKQCEVKAETSDLIKSLKSRSGVNLPSNERFPPSDAHSTIKDTRL
jgi:hypothetical protein